MNGKPVESAENLLKRLKAKAAESRECSSRRAWNRVFPDLAGRRHINDAADRQANPVTTNPRLMRPL